MTLRQYRRWKVMAVRFARIAYPLATAARQKLLVDNVGLFFVNYCDGESQWIEDVECWESLRYPAKGYGPTDTLREFLHGQEIEHYEGRFTFHDMVSAVIRAAFDVAVEPSAGVVGFKIGDLRRAWKPKPVPAWVWEFFEDPASAQCEKDEAGVWL